MNKNIFSIDPSINEIGWATINITGIEIADVIKTQGDTLEAKLQDLAAKVQRAILNPAIPHPCSVLIELPAAFTYTRSANRQTGRGMNAASLQKLNLAIGVIFGVVVKLGIKPVFVPVAWKGRSNKRLSMAITGIKNHNASDALLMLRWYKARR